MSTRRSFLTGSLGAGAAIALGLPGSRWAGAQGTSSEEARNKAVVRLYKESQGTPEYPDVLKEVQSPDYTRLRAGFHHLAANAANDPALSAAAEAVRVAVPDRRDTIEQMIADGDRVGMLFRVQGTHRGNLFGIPATGKTIDVHEIGIFKLEAGKIVEAFFMADELGLLQQLGAGVPARSDGRFIAPPIPEDGQDGDAMLARLMANPLESQAYRNKLVVAATKAPSAPDGLRQPGSGRERLRAGFEHLGTHGRANGVGDQTIGQAFPDRRDKVDHVLAEGDKVWMQFRLSGTNTKSIYGLPPSDGRVEVPEFGIATFEGDRWKDAWYFGDELGLLLQIGQPSALMG